MPVHNKKGNFSFLKGISTFSSGCFATEGFEIIHATIKPVAPLDEGFRLVERHLRQLVHRPMNALCGMELRIPKPLTQAGFEEFNAIYIKRLESWGLLVDGFNPVARTNVAFELNPVPEPSLSGFYYTMPSNARRPTFVLSGAGEVKLREDNRLEITARGDVSAEGMKLKAATVMQAQTAKLSELGLNPGDATTINLYTVHDPHDALRTLVLPILSDAARQGINWFYARPPVVEVEFEMDMRGVCQELVIAP